ncbi:MAG: carboxylating nicotinate-nucleotide diphosphorylase [Deltaproteobacteria bacterium]|nr:carboxylating nicotinate-nucleotide diphosphorylase [Deltaproteobacteria bacterium]
MTPLVEQLVNLALSEDVGRGDATARSVLFEPVMAKAQILAKEHLVVCGHDLAAFAMFRVDPSIKFEALVSEGSEVEPGTAIAQISGQGRALLAGERTVLNFLMHLSGIATLTRKYVKIVAATGTKAKIVDTRKTTPGWRLLEKYAVACGGGANHRMDLASGILIKENHIAMCDSTGEAVERARKLAPHSLRIEVEVRSIEEMEEAIEAGTDVVLLDNMTPETMAKAVAQAAGRVLIEASGGINLETVADVARTGVDLISVGRLTHSAPAVDLSLQVVEAEIPADESE